MEDGFPTTTLGNDKGNVNDKKNSWVAHSLLPSPELAEGWDLNIRSHYFNFSARIIGWIPRQA